MEESGKQLRPDYLIFSTTSRNKLKPAKSRNCAASPDGATSKPCAKITL